MDVDLASRLLGSITAENLVIFCGAGLSMAPPSSLPSARALASDCYPKYERAIGGTLPADARDDLDAQCRFAFGRGELQKLFISKLVNWRPFYRNPNKGHVALGDVLAIKAIRCVITTNFDTLVEEAAEDLGEDVLLGALDGAEAGVGRLHQPYIKIHGCARRDRDNTLWCREQVVPGSPLQTRIDSCKTWLRGNLNGRDLLLVGF